MLLLLLPIANGNQHEKQLEAKWRRRPNIQRWNQVFFHLIIRLLDSNTLTQMSLCDSLQVIGHSGLRTKIKERKKSRCKNASLWNWRSTFDCLGTPARINSFMTWTQPPTLPKFVENNAGETHQFPRFQISLSILFCPASGDWVNDTLACKFFSSPTAVPQSRIKMSAGRGIVILIVVVAILVMDHDSWSLSNCILGSWSLSDYSVNSALKPFSAGWRPPSPAWSSWASARTPCSQTPPSPRLPGKAALCWI